MVSVKNDSGDDLSMHTTFYNLFAVFVVRSMFFIRVPINDFTPLLKSTQKNLIVCIGIHNNAIDLQFYKKLRILFHFGMDFYRFDLWIYFIFEKINGFNWCMDCLFDDYYSYLGKTSRIYWT